MVVLNARHFVYRYTYLGYILFYFCFLTTPRSSAQSSIYKSEKEVLSSTAFDRWQEFPQIGISRNGRYIYFFMDRPSCKKTKLVIRETDRNRYIELPCFSKPWFSADSRSLIWMASSDSLCILSLRDFTLSYISNVIDFWVQNNFLLYKVGKPNYELFIVDLKTGRVKSFSNVAQFQFSSNGKSIVIWSQLNETMQSLISVSLDNGKVSTVWQGRGLDMFVIDDVGEKVAFMIKDSLWLYQKSRCSRLIGLEHMPSGYEISRLLNFSRDGENLFIAITNSNMSFFSEVETRINIWSYQMKRLPRELKNKQQRESRLATVSFSSQRVYLLEYPGELVYFPGYEKKTDSVCLVYCLSNEIFDHEGTRTGLWELLYTKTGRRKKLEFTRNASFAVISLGGKYIIFYDEILKNFFSYEISIEKLRNVTDGIGVVWEKNFDEGIYGYKNIFGWLKDDNAFLVRSQDDIWQIDPARVKNPIRLTNGYGKTHHIRLFLALEEYAYRPLGDKESIILSAFDPVTKNNGFYKMRVGESTDPELLTMGPYLYCITENPEVPSYFNFPPIKAKDADKYILRRMSVTDAPNYYLTEDFKSLQRVTEIAPQKEFNWYTTELHSWKSPDDFTLQGILYKPENFDSLKKYPVIFYFYERMSARLNAYIRPEVLTAGSSINIPYYVSNGYLIFCPDIQYKMGDPMQGAYNAIVSAASYLSNLPYVNIRKIGVQGSSWGAIQVNYLITHTNIFAAACSVSGLSNWISGYGGLMADGISTQEIYEKGQLRVGATLWEKPEIYIKNSAVLSANKVTTPLLMMHTRNDELCSFENILEFFTALRRLGKRSWLLEYEGNHTLMGKDAEDFSIRMKQFFDHYLMDKPAPKWMTQSASMREQSGSYGLELDDSIRTPGRGLNIKQTY